MRVLPTVLLALLLLPLSARGETFRPLAPDLEIAELPMPEPAPLGDSRVTVVRVTPSRGSLRLYGGGDRLTGREWAEKEGLRVVVNAGMFQFWGQPVSYARSGKLVLNRHKSKEHMFLAAEPPPGSAPMLLDDACDDVKSQEPRFGVVLQGIRMIDCHREVRWSASLKRWSVVAVGIDAAGRVLFVHCRSPYTMRRFAELLKTLPIGLERLMYLEGGPEATLFVRAGGEVHDLVGSYETGFFESDNNHRAWQLPNVIGVK